MKRFGKSAKVSCTGGLVVLLVFAFAGRALGQPKFAYVANQQDNTISAYMVDSTTGGLTEITGSPFPTTVPGVPFRTGGFSPTALALDPSGKFLFVANQCSDMFCLGTPGVSGNVSAFTIDSTSGALTAVAGSPFSAGLNPVALAVDPSGKFVYAVNLNGGSPLSAGVSAFTINSTTGVLTPVTGSPFATGVTPISVAVDPSGKFVYVANLITRNISAYTINSATGALSPVAGSPFSAGVAAAPRAVAVDPSGKFAYVTDIAVNKVLAFTIDSTTGALTSVAGSPFSAGTGPVSVAVDPLGGFVYVANQSSNNISAYAMDSTTGALTAAPGSPFPAPTLPTSPPAVTGGPDSVAVDPSGKFAYVVNGYHSNSGPVASTVSAYTIGANGALSSVSGSPFTAGNSSGSVVVAGQTVVPPSQQITNLMNTVNSLNLLSGIADSLNAQLTAAQASLTANNVTAACNQVSAFIHEVAAQSGKHLTVAQADQLTAQADAIKTGLGCR